MSRRWSRGAGSPASLQQRLPFTRDDVLDDEDLHPESPNLLSPAQSRTIPASSHTQRRLSASYLSSSVGHRVPTRSFAHGSAGHYEPLQFSSEGVRDQTQQIAHWAFEQAADNDRRHGDASASVHTEDDGGTTASAVASSIRSLEEQDSGSRRGRQDQSQPRPILEVSEPPSPEAGDVEDADVSETMLVPTSEHIDTGRLTERASLATTTATYHRRHSGENYSGNTLVDERTSLLPRYVSQSHASASDSLSSSDRPAHEIKPQQNRLQGVLHELSRASSRFWRSITTPETWQPSSMGKSSLHLGMSVVEALPAVFLGWLLNVLDALSYGTILFPLGEPIFQETGPDGIAIFFVSTIIAQLVYSSFSRFKGGVGSEMIEVVPFFHKMAYLIMARVGSDAPAKVIMSTVYISYIISSIITGAIFMLLGAFRLGNLVSFFPRSILTGCIGGVGVFLFLTGIEVSAGIDGNIEYSLDTLQRLMRLETLPLWTIPLFLAIVLMILKSFSDRSSIVPTYFIAIFAIFYLVVAVVPNYNLEQLRDAGWIFEKPKSGVEFYHFYSYYNLGLVNWSAILQCLPTMLALSFFGILHVPINVPALALAVQADDISTNQELINHGISNTVSGFAGSIQNYLVYANSSMFIKNGGDSRLAGFLLAAATFATWTAGPEAIGYIPKMIVGTLIYLLGIDLVKEALWDTFGRINMLEYIMIIAIVLIMGFHDFVVGIGVGIVLSSLIFVVQTSRISAVRASFDGTIAESTVRRHPTHRKFLQRVGCQLRVLKLAGYLFFGTIVDVEKQVRHLLQDDEFSRQPIQFLVLDFLHVTGIDFSAAEGFARLRRLLSRKEVTMVLSGISMTGELGQNLAMVGLFIPSEDDADQVPCVFEDLNRALEACENDQLVAFKARSEANPATTSVAPIPRSSTTLRPDPGKFDSQIGSPRRSLLRTVATDTIESEQLPAKKWRDVSQPTLLMLQTFRNLSDKDIDFWFQASRYFKRVRLARGDVLYSAGEASDGFYILEEGILRADYDLRQGSYQESIVAGTTCGELPFFAGLERSATVVAERDCVAWLLSRGQWEKLGAEWPQGEAELLGIGLKLTAERMGAVTSYVLVTAS